MMAFQISDYTVIQDGAGNIQSIRGPNGMSIPPDPMNSRYQDFLAVDTEKKLCARQTLPAPAAYPAPTVEDRLKALEAGQTAIAAKVGVTLTSKENL